MYLYFSSQHRGDSSLWFPILLWSMGAVTVAVGIVVGFYLIRKYRESKWGKCKSKRRMEGKIVIVTGANSGIGKETARDLASRGAIVIMACRNRQAALEALRDIRTTTGDGDLIFMDLDLADLTSIRTFASNFLEKFDKLDVLVNNAGVYVPPDERKKTKDGFEIHFGVNHLGHFLLTHLLLNRIESTPNSRIVIVSSSLYKYGQIDFDNLEAEKGWDTKKRNALYSNSKLANIFHGQELAKRLHGLGTPPMHLCSQRVPASLPIRGKGVGTFVLCPGFVYTGLMRYSAPRFNWAKKLFFLPIMFFFMRTAKQGAQTSIHSAVSEELDEVEWAFLANCKIEKLADVAQDEAASARLWDVSMDLVGENGSDLLGEEGVLLDVETPPETDNGIDDDVVVIEK
ncbi:retinol dehydrogenase 11-like isoform X1 [Macrobrachium rosenbergii]|uniref:retinol dehydrogenase 11-like isoform X1 n=1 Tax=Macrobrachium rosenbergii TaxID=79674 RepID=UPI0034D5A952